MDDTDKQPATSPLPPANNGGVMDIQSPKTAQDSSPADHDSNALVEEPGLSPEAAPVSTVVATEPVAPEQPPTESPTADTSKQAENSPSSVASSTDTDNPLAINKAPTPKKKSGAPIIVIVVATIIALGLCALVISIYFKSKNDTKKTSTNTSQQTASKITPDELDQAVKDTDEDLSQLDDTKDFPDGELTDQTLGL